MSLPGGNSRYPVRNLDEIANETERQNHQTTLNTVTGILGEHNSHIYLDEEQRLRGHFGILTHTPGLAVPFLQLVGELYKLKLDPELREIVILATGSHHKAAYPNYVHSTAAADLSSLEPRLMAQIMQGEKPDDLSKAGSAVYDLALALLRGGGPLPDELFNRVKGLVGEEQTLAAIHFVGMYSYINVICNGAGSASSADA